MQIKGKKKKKSKPKHTRGRVGGGEGEEFWRNQWYKDQKINLYTHTHNVIYAHTNSNST